MECAVNANKQERNMKAHAEKNTGGFACVRKLAYHRFFIVRAGGSALAAVLCVVGLLVAQAAIDDPVGYWSFEDAEGVLANRVTSGPYHDATVLSGSPTFGIVPDATNIVGNALLLDGASALRLPYHQDNLGTNFTIAMWYWQTTNDTRQCLYQTQKGTWNVSYEAYYLDFSQFASYVGQAAAGNVASRLKEWIHVAHTFSTADGDTTLNVYTNGAFALAKKVSSSSVFEIYQIAALHIGAHRDTGRHFKGMIDELALWNRTLSAQEVAALCQRGRDGQPLAVTPGIWPRIDLGGDQWAFALNVDEGLSAGVYQDGWLMNGIQTLPPARQVFDTACRVDDTANHADGPFHAERTDGPKFRTPVTEAGLGQVTLGDFTIEARFRTTDGQRGVLLGSFAGSGLRALNLELLTSNIVRLYIQPVTTGQSTLDMQISAGTVNTRDGEWHHLAGVRRGEVVYLYLDGEEVLNRADTTGSYALNTTYFFLKGDSRTDATMFYGDIENARLWTRGLSTNEVSSLAAGVEPGGTEVPSTGMLAEYPGLYSPYHAEYANPKYRVPVVQPLTYLTRTNWTVETWFRTTDTQRGILMGNYTGASTRGLNLELSTGTGLRLYVQNTNINLSVYGAALTSRNGEWHHLAGLRRDGQLYLYLNGQQVGTHADPTGSYDLDETYWYLARDGRPSTGVTAFEGELRHARMWSRALGNNEVAALAAGKLPGDAEVSNAGMLTDYTYLLPTNDLNTAGFQGQRFLRSYMTSTNRLSLVFEGVPRHTEVGLGLLLAQLDTLEPVGDNDHFEIRVDGTEVLSARLGFGDLGQSQIVSFSLFGQPADIGLLADTLTLGGENLFYCGEHAVDYDDHVYDLSLLEALQRIPHTGSTLTLELLGIQSQPGINEGFGVDQIELTVTPVKGTFLLLH